MPRYKAIATISYDCIYEFDSDDFNTAYDLALNADGDLFKEIPMSGDWRLLDVREVENAQV
jgi:hypothetical protein